MPERGGNVGELLDLLHLGSERDRLLVLAWEVSLLHPNAAYWMLLLVGEQDSGKSAAARILRRMTDPNVADLRAKTADERELLIQAQRSWVTVLENVSYLDQEGSDSLCRLLDGAGLSKRRLYSDSSEQLFAVRRPILATSIADVVTSGDLASRTLRVQLSAIDDAHRLGDEALDAAAKECRPRVLGALLDAATCTLANIDAVKLDRLPRRADLARWVTAAEPAFGLASGTFVQALMASREESLATVADASSIASAIRAVARRGFKGTATELSVALAEEAGPDAMRSRSWPRTPKGFSDALRRLAPSLRDEGFEVSFNRGGHGGRRTISLSPAAGASPQGKVVPLPTAASRPAKAPGGPSEEQVASAILACGANSSWQAFRLVNVARLKANGDPQLAVAGLNRAGLPGPGGGRWTLDSLSGVS